MVYSKKDVACAKKATNHYYVHLYYRVKESFVTLQYKRCLGKDCD